MLRYVFEYSKRFGVAFFRSCAFEVLVEAIGQRMEELSMELFEFGAGEECFWSLWYVEWSEEMTR